MPEKQPTITEASTRSTDSPGRVVSNHTLRDLLVVFARYPEPGRVKTRLIPALGAEGAARVQRALALRTFRVASDFHFDRGVSVEAWYTGGDETRMARLIEPYPIRCRSQHGADLGERMRCAVAAAFRCDVRRVVVIGTDCPEITPETLAEAFDALDHADVVLGPAFDGGYYLVGMRADRPELFRDVDWGSEHVLRQTLDRCRDIGCSTRQLKPLVDVDHAEDLLVCRRVGVDFSDCFPSAAPGRISVVIPTLNEEGQIEQTIRRALDGADVEVIVADGGSVDRTVEIARRRGAKVVPVRRGRGRQMNAGAAMASGEALLFLHADTRLPDSFAEHVWSTLDRGVVAGAFRLRIDGRGAGLRLVERGANLRSRLWQMPYGDQGFFIRAEDFLAVGGFKHWPLMEDYELCRRLKRIGRIGLASAPATTSGRRWQDLGVMKTTLVNQCCIAAFRLGVSPERVARYYYGRRMGG